MVEGSKKVVIDTNLLVRYLINDDQKKADAVDNLLDRAIKSELKIVVPSVVIAELVWILESFYQLEADAILELVEAIGNTSGLDVTDKAMVISALRLYKNRNIDFIDAWIIEFAKERGIRSIYTFDKKHFRDIEGIEVAIGLHLSNQHLFFSSKPGEIFSIVTFLFYVLKHYYFQIIHYQKNCSPQQLFSYRF